MTTEVAKQEIQRLVVKYEALDSRTIKRYKEANTKDGFVQPLFEALGWDFANFDEVEAEKTITSERVDYLFKLNKVSKFCLEIKAFHVDINEERWVRQAIGYAYNKGVTWAVLTNFKTLRVFNAERETKDINQIAFLNLTHSNYLTDFHRLWLLSREAVANKDLDKEAEAYGRLPPRLAVEKRLYAQLRDWRETLFNEIYLYYKDDKEERLAWPEVDQLVQHLLNRLIFIRTVEDRGLIDRNLLAARHQWESSGGTTDLMGSLRDIFHQFAILYDSDLFPLAMDRWDLVSVHNDRILSDIIQGLYEVPGGLADWNFATIGSDVLGTVYEQYLGYVPAKIQKEVKDAQKRLFPDEPHIGLTAKKEKRKGEGIYYTPSWVVDYIVKQTVGRFIEEHDYNDILNIKVLDPACGSGSFLTRAYEELLNYHACQQGKSPADLDQAERTRILLRNIYGVDLDQQAVEITRLSLLLCSLSGQETLPSLANNVCLGNSLISGTDEDLRTYLGDRWREVKPFNWEDRFPETMKNGGFDVVIGNPPYIPIESMKDYEKRYFQRCYPQLERKYDSSVVFILTFLNKLRPSGRLGFISSVTWQTGENFRKLREYLFSQAGVETLINLPFDVFKGAYVDTGVYILSQAPKDGYFFYRFPKKARPSDLRDIRCTYISRQFITPPNYKIVLDPEAQSILDRLSSDPRYVQLGTLTISTQGLAGNRFQTQATVKGEWWYPFLDKGQVYRYVLQVDRVTFANLSEHSSLKPFYGKKPKLLIRRVISRKDRLMATYTDQKIVLKKDINPFVITDPKLNSLFILGILNSRLISYFYVNTSSIATKDDFRQTTLAELRRLPIRCIDFENIAEKKMHNELVSLVDRMLYLNRGLAPIRNTPCNERDELIREIERTDRNIDNLVYDLYGLTDEERQIVEEQTNRGGS